MKFCSWMLAFKLLYKLKISVYVFTLGAFAAVLCRCQGTGDRAGREWNSGGEQEGWADGEGTRQDERMKSICDRWREEEIATDRGERQREGRRDDLFERKEDGTRKACMHDRESANEREGV